MINLNKKADTWKLDLFEFQIFRKVFVCLLLSVDQAPVRQQPYIVFNPLSPNGDQHLFSPNDIHTLSRDKVMRIHKMITKEKMF